MSTSWESFGRRFVGALRLNRDLFREVSRAPTALSQAIAVILLASLASALVFLIRGEARGLSVVVVWERYPITRESNVAAAVAGGILDACWGLIIWAIQAAIIWLIWNRFGSHPMPSVAIATPLGFANAPLVVSSALEVIPIAGGLMAAIGLIWVIAASLVAIRAVLDVGWRRAVVLFVISTGLLVPLSILLDRWT
ncbi:MAG: hypothetical protein KC438_05700 [Thermomicrobiales bacterium]|nr:hypothetical protein [Thermomicrobiales bacterium]MCO5223083.1 hypothetical protein [Thermomicrobiales bacterium]